MYSLCYVTDLAPPSIRKSCCFWACKSGKKKWNQILWGCKYVLHLA